MMPKVPAMPDGGPNRAFNDSMPLVVWTSLPISTGQSRAQRLGLFHHLPDRTDDEVERMMHDARCDDVEVLITAQGFTVHLPGWS